MGAAKIPEQVMERFEMGRRALLEDQVRDPIIDRMMAIPVNQIIRPEENNRRCALSASSIKNTEVIMKRLIYERRLKATVLMIERITSKRLSRRTPIQNKQLALLMQHAQKLRALLPAKVGKKKTHTLKRSKKGKIRRSVQPR